MSIHYNAFISYRHHPDDIRVASDIHRSLERFRVPKSIRKKTGKIERLFRDKEELPITSNLSDDIGSALRNSDYLIVICSVHTKESVWVQREIELFLKSHDRSKVLTVLASGEPYDVIPDVLLYEDVVDPVTGETVRREFEPLSCDWRIKRRKAVQEELPRLAAALLGCAYDELRQRQKQYRARRNMAIISSALAASMSLSAYFLYTSITIHRANVQIQENLNQSLINQSMHLTTAAQERLAEGDRLTAITLAMAALPGENNVRPYVPEAENMLVSALGVYNTASNVSAVGTVSAGMNIGIRNFYVTPSENVLYLYDRRNMMTAWDTEHLQKLGQISVAMTPKKVMTQPNDNVIVLPYMSDGPLASYRPDGECVWQWEKIVDIAAIGDSGDLLAIQQSAEGYALLHLNGLDGTLMGDPVSLEASLSGLTPSAFLTEELPQNSVAVIRYSALLQDAVLYAVDPVSGDGRILETETAYPGIACVTDDGKLLMMVSGGDVGFAGIFEGNRVTTTGTVKILCYGISTGELLWENQMSSCRATGCATLAQIPGSERILCQAGNGFAVLDRATGEAISRCEAGSFVEALSVGERYARAILHDGYLCNYWYDENYCYEVKCMESGVSEAYVDDAYYSMHWNGDHVTFYRDVEGLPLWETDFDNGFSVGNQKAWGEYLTFQDSGSLYMFDTASRQLLWKKDRGNRELLDFSADGTKLWCADGTKNIIALDVVTGAEDTRAIVADAENPDVSIREGLYYKEDQLYYIAVSMKIPQLVCWDPVSDEKQSWPLEWDEQEDTIGWSWKILEAQEQYVWIWVDQKQLLEVDLTSGNVRCILTETNYSPAIALQDTEKVAIANQSGIQVGTPGQEPDFRIDLDGANAGSLYFRNGELLALCDNGFLYCFDSMGTELSRTKLQVSDNFSSLLKPYSTLTGVSWQEAGENVLIVNALGNGNMIHCDTWSVKTTIPEFILYGNNDVLLCKRGAAIVGYPVYETARLLELAKTELNGFQLSPEQRAAYGIDG